MQLHAASLMHSQGGVGWVVWWVRDGGGGSFFAEGLPVGCMLLLGGIR